MSNTFDYDPDYMRFHRRIPAAEEIIHHMRGMEQRIMTALGDAVAQLVADDAALAAEVDALIGGITQIPGEIAAAVQTALADAGVSDEAVRAAVVASDAVVQAAVERAKTALAPPVAAVPPAPPAPAPEPAPAPAPVDTVVAGAGDDSVSAGAGADTTTA